MDWLAEVKRIKTEKGMKNDVLAEKSGIPLGTLNKILTGQTGSPKLSTVTALADALEVSVCAIIGESDMNDDEKDIIKK